MGGDLVKYAQLNTIMSLMWLYKRLRGPNRGGSLVFHPFSLFPCDLLNTHEKHKRSDERPGVWVNYAKRKCNLRKHLFGVFG